MGLKVSSLFLHGVKVGIIGWRASSSSRSVNIVTLIFPIPCPTTCIFWRPKTLKTKYVILLSRRTSLNNKGMPIKDVFIGFLLPLLPRLFLPLTSPNRHLFPKINFAYQLSILLDFSILIEQTSPLSSLLPS